MSNLAGIEDINAYCGSAFIRVRELFEARKLDLSRFDNLMMENKSVSLPCEDVVTCAVNAALPLIHSLGDAKDKIDMVITATESGLDFGKSVSTYIHKYLELHTHCRLFEVKQACYAGTAALQMAMNYVWVNPGRKVLVIASDEARVSARMSYAEPSQGVASVAMLIGDNPRIFSADRGANGLCGYEIMDTCRPTPDIETGDPDISLYSYIDCLEKSYQHYTEKVDNVDLLNSFSYLVFHTPFAGMVKGAHRKLLRTVKKLKPADIDTIFRQQVSPSLMYCQQVGNVYSASTYLALCGLIDHAEIQQPVRIGIFSYGSGCSSEFFSGIVLPEARQILKGKHIQQHLDERVKLDIAAYDHVLNENEKNHFGIKDYQFETAGYQDLYNRAFSGKGLLVLDKVDNYHRIYKWS
ncbi:MULTISPECIES: hydroxymethylglutaryl-CoA synthase family protein [Enterobacter cloacae complex]|uniref:hydroxymethylglutaryl-CoA synthase family protein n=1 Tax=Enterobacter cloacae complex TaxID=354276 RepID=UPI000793A759|nr:hydroxymethylglutaryl-CoA synthase [Enterobacter ludwigii]WNI43105.1 hydroxymethylglutaryl-CoA synthase [Enterobacter ludwigii]WNI52146.1 hydroxymethylglutaryl-CoA synthase [Enterobacter ludwigii]WNI83932.1 hydroxymethylglutaryl-CoA synthase [Enterobacter ludwigii]SAC79398.1 Polyketide biosynthesis 3-hydroxy-3-methylglutaryl-ACP synthase pksG [Enterobacter ludwigii]